MDSSSKSCMGSVFGSDPFLGLQSSNERTFQRCVEQKAASSNKQVANECHQEDCVVSIFQTATDPLGGQVHEQHIRERVDNLRRILRNNIVLLPSVHHPSKQVPIPRTSSHQSSVDVTGENHPSCSGGYGIDGSRANSAAI